MAAVTVRAAALDKPIQGVVKFGERLANHTTLRVGGSAAYFVIPSCAEDIASSVDFARERELPWTVIGNGSNVLFADEAYPGVVIKMTPALGRVHLDPRRGTVSAQAGAGLAQTRNLLKSSGFRDFDLLVGIPGTIGGALAMNAGIPEGCISDLTETVTVMTDDGALRTLAKDDCGFAYRRSRFRRERLIVVEAFFKIGRDVAWDGEALLARRKQTQPLGQASPGCVFVNPEGQTAGRLIERAGLKGARVGGAMISTKHANFLVNEGGATSQDVLRLIDIVRAAVLKCFGVELKLELAIIAH